jgi:site-specific DNA-cytosine methylase
VNILSLFDGMACGLVAAKRAGLKVDNYFASEIDKYAIQIVMKNHPEIIHLGDINDYPSWDLPKIDLIIGGFPCQGFSFAGKQLNFDDQRSALFFKLVEILWQQQEKNKDTKFMFENVKMKKEYRDAIS